MADEKGYTVVEVQQVNAMGPGGTKTPQYVVWIKTNRGATGRLQVSRTDWNEETLAELLSEKAAELDLAFEV